MVKTLYPEDGVTFMGMGIGLLLLSIVAFLASWIFGVFLFIIALGFLISGAYLKWKGE